MNAFKRAIRRMVVKAKSRGSSIPGSTSISPKARIVCSRFEGLNTVGYGCRIAYSEIGFGSYVSNDTELLTTRVGRYCSIGPHVTMPTGKHPISEFVSSSPLFYSSVGIDGKSFVSEDKFEEYKYAADGYTRIIGNDVWIGGGVILLEGITVGDGAVIGAGSLVTKNVPAYSIVLGVPARVVRYRFDEKTIQRLLKINWWNRSPQWLEDNSAMFNDVEGFLQLMEN